MSCSNSPNMGLQRSKEYAYHQVLESIITLVGDSKDPYQHCVFCNKNTMIQLSTSMPQKTEFPSLHLLLSGVKVRGDINTLQLILDKSIKEAAVTYFWDSRYCGKELFLCSIDNHGPSPMFSIIDPVMEGKERR